MSLADPIQLRRREPSALLLSAGGQTRSGRASARRRRLLVEKCLENDDGQPAPDTISRFALTSTLCPVVCVFTFGVSFWVLGLGRQTAFSSARRTSPWVAQVAGGRLGLAGRKPPPQSLPDCWRVGLRAKPLLLGREAAGLALGQHAGSVGVAAASCVAFGDDQHVLAEGW